jgi:hypothetical protein
MEGGGQAEKEEASAEEGGGEGDEGAGRHGRSRAMDCLDDVM